MVQNRGGVLMKTKTKVSYVVLKYDDQTDGIYMNSSSKITPGFGLPEYEYHSPNNSLADIADDLAQQLNFPYYKIDVSHVFVPFLTVYNENKTKIYHYVAVVFESTRDEFSSRRDESWHRVKLDQKTQKWSLPFGNGLIDSNDYQFKNYAKTDYAANPELNPEITFSNVMRYVEQETLDFPILGLLSGDKFTMRQVLHYQDLLGIETLKAGNNMTFEHQYSQSIQTIQDDRMTTSYRIKKEYLQK
jgi:hypothetical protein